MNVMRSSTNMSQKSLNEPTQTPIHYISFVTLISFVSVLRCGLEAVWRISLVLRKMVSLLLIHLFIYFSRVE